MDKNRPKLRLKNHIGVDSFFAERAKILDTYDQAKKQANEDQVKTDHGIVAEALVRDWLRAFLPKRFGVCKGLSTVLKNFTILGREKFTTFPFAANFL
ncbi:MAG: hypothetical protein WA081_17835 [Desulfosalsimonadaceae bacterium]